MFLIVGSTIKVQIQSSVTSYPSESYKSMPYDIELYAKKKGLSIELYSFDRPLSLNV